MEGYINLFTNDHEGTNRPHYKGYLKIDGIDHEFALWPNKDGKVGFSGKYKPRQPKEPVSNVTQADADRVWDEAEKTLSQPKPVESKASLADLNDPVPF